MYVIVFEAWNGKRCEVVFGEELKGLKNKN